MFWTTRGHHNKLTYKWPTFSVSCSVWMMIFCFLCIMKMSSHWERQKWVSPPVGAACSWQTNNSDSATELIRRGQPRVTCAVHRVCVCACVSVDKKQGVWLIQLRLGLTFPPWISFSLNLLTQYARSLSLTHIHTHTRMHACLHTHTHYARLLK